MVKLLKTRSKRTKRGTKTRTRKTRTRKTRTRKQTRNRKTRNRNKTRRGGKAFVNVVNSQYTAEKKKLREAQEKAEMIQEHQRQQRQRQRQQEQIKEEERIAKKPLNRMSSFFRSKFSKEDNK
jgi:hypothetical protein